MCKLMCIQGWFIIWRSSLWFFLYSYKNLNLTVRKYSFLIHWEKKKKLRILCVYEHVNLWNMVAMVHWKMSLYWKWQNSNVEYTEASGVWFFFFAYIFFSLDLCHSPAYIGRRRWGGKNEALRYIEMWCPFLPEAVSVLNEEKAECMKKEN